MCIFAGALAGIDLDSLIVRFPAWRTLGPTAWASYSRQADLRNGRILYPALAIGHALLAIIAVTGLHYGGPTTAILAAYVVVGMAIVSLLLTTPAAPIMLRLNSIGDDPELLERAFRGFVRWSLFRAVAQILAFIASLWLLMLIRA